MSLLSFPAKSLDQNLSDFVLIFLEIMKHVQSIDHNPISFVDIPEPEERKTFKIKKMRKLQESCVLRVVLHRPIDMMSLKALFSENFVSFTLWLCL